MQNSQPLSLRSLTGFLFTHNPFYLISALLVLIGLHESLSGDASQTGGWLLMGVLAGYTLLLVAAGYVIIRVGQVWEDARMILLVIVLLFLALSVSFDKIVLTNPQVGARFLLVGLAFCVFASEAVFQSLGIRLAARYRVPYYGLLGLLFLYPLALAQLSIAGQVTAMSLGVYLFPMAAAIVFALLVPAARTRGQDQPPNGTPWPWPWFPWTLFAFLLLAVGLRSYSLSMAFEGAGGMSASFSPYFLTPLVLVTALLLFEMAMANASPRTLSMALLLPIVCLPMSLPGTSLNFVANHFLTMLARGAGSPLQIALVGLGAFYAFVWLRGVRAGEIGLVACITLASIVDRHTIDIFSFTNVRSLPFALIAMVELPLGLWRRSSWRVVASTAACLVALRASDLATDLTQQADFILGHAGAIVVLVLSTMYDDRWARLFRHATLPLLPAAALITATAYDVLFPETSRVDHAVFLAALGAVTILYWRRTPGVPQTLAIVATAASLVILSSRGMYLELESSPLEKGLPWLAGGLAALAVAMLTSLIKGGVFMPRRQIAEPIQRE